MNRPIIIPIGVVFLFFALISNSHALGGKKRNPVELSFWHSMSIYQGNTLENFVDEYNQKNSDAQVKLIFQGLYEDTRTKLIQVSKTGDLPDIAQIAIEYLDVFIKDNKIEAITDYIPEEDRTDILAQFWNSVTRDREIYAYPFNLSVQVLYYNKDAFKKAGLDPENPPKTWDDVIRYGESLTTDFDGNGTIDQWGIMISLEGVFGFTPLIRQVGGEFLNEDRTAALFNSSEGVKVMKLLQDMAYNYRIMPSNWTLFEGTSAFLRGKIAMGPITSAGIKYAEENLPWELGIAPLPYIENKSVLLGGAGLVIFSKSTYRKKVAHNFVQWLTNRDNSILWHEETGYLPLRKSAINSFELQSFYRLNPIYKIPVDQLPYSRPPDFTPFFPQIDQIIRFAIENIMINRQDPREMLDLAAQKVDELLRQEETR
jgi:sn-glycerol 3-phosphate transport system substrate-binding protein